MAAVWAHARLHPSVDAEPAPFATFYERWRRYGAEALTEVGGENIGEAWARCRADAHRRAVPYSDVAPALETLRSAGLRLGVLSDADNDFLQPCLYANGLVFDVVLTSEDLRCYKPHVSAFRSAADRLELPPDAIAYVGDNPLNDVVGSRNAGMRDVWLNRLGRTWPDRFPPPTATLETLDRILGTLERM